jgi:uncharacterized protein (DUF4415 family)
MSADDDTRRYSRDALRVEGASGQNHTKKDAPVCPVDAAFWRDAHVVMPPPNETSVHLRLDNDVLAWFRKQGPGQLSRMNAVLRSFMLAQKR